MSETAKDRIPPFVYVADSDRGTADSLAAVLNENGYEAIAFSSGEQLVEAATVLKPAIVITAVSMEGITGVEAAIRICQNIPECRVVLCFALHSADESLRRIAAENRFVVFRGPVDPGALLQCLDGITGRAPTAA